MFKNIIFAVIVLAMTGCATTMDWTPTGGSRSDGIVKLQYEYGGFESPVLNENQAIEAAALRCKAWGYNDAEAFGGEVRRCVQGSMYGCVRYSVTKDYQCTGSSTSNSAPTVD